MSNLSKEAFKDLEMKNLWNYFYNLTQIPRESGNEQEVRNYLIKEAEKNNFEYHVDKSGNLIIKVKATAGYESAPSLALQGHLDMVCVKDELIVHDFAKDPLNVYRDGDFIKAKGTTLGADNGVAVAIIFDLFTDKEAKHGPLEAIFTVSEETGLEGAFGLEPSLIESRTMINLDSEEEGVFYIGCAGGIETKAIFEFEKRAIDKNSKLFELNVDSLLGGHSGGEIHKQRANAISVTARTLRSIADKFPLQLISIDGGTKRNVIPSTTKTLFAVPSDEKEICSIVNTTLNLLKKEFKEADPDLNIECTIKDNGEKQALSHESSISLINALFATHHGVDRVSQTIEDLVETSSNLASIRTTEKEITIISSHRSSLQSSRDHVARRWNAIFELIGAKTSTENGYPAWTPNVDSPIAKLVARVWQKKMGQKAKVTAIHAGLECGIINSLVEGMDSVSMGPILLDVHSTKERLSISSTEKLAKFLRDVCLEFSLSTL